VGIKRVHDGIEQRVRQVAVLGLLRTPFVSYPYNETKKIPLFFETLFNVLAVAVAFDFES
jgi:hypothetical protein